MKTLIVIAATTGITLVGSLYIAGSQSRRDTKYRKAEGALLTAIELKFLKMDLDVQVQELYVLDDAIRDLDIDTELNTLRSSRHMELIVRVYTRLMKATTNAGRRLELIAHMNSHLATW